MSADVLPLPKAGTTQPPIEHTITVRLSSAGAGFFLDGKPIPLELAATIVTCMAQLITAVDTAGGT